MLSQSTIHALALKLGPPYSNGEPSPVALAAAENVSKDKPARARELCVEHCIPIEEE